MKISIHKKILGLSLSGLLSCTLLLGGVSLYFTSNLLQKKSTENLEATLTILQSRIYQHFTGIERYTSTLSISILGDIETIETVSNVEKQEALTQKANLAIKSSIKNTDQTVAVYLRYNPKLAPPTSGIFMTKLGEEYENVTPTDFSMFDADDIEHVGWYYEPIRNGKPMWMSPYLNKNINVYMISYVVPLFKFNEEIGVVGVDIDFTTILDQVSSIKLFENGYAFLEDLNGKILCHKKLNIGDRFNPPASDAVFRSKLPNGMVLGIAVPKTELNAERYKLLAQIFLFAFFVLMLFSFISALFALSITKPILKLTHTANKLINGDMDVEFDLDRTDEIGDLARSFAMAKKHLQDNIKQIQGLAFKDSLTGIRNRAAFDVYAKELNDQIKVHQVNDVGIALFDTNNLKDINNNYGQEKGNLFISGCCKLICKTFVHSPVFRIGGDQFIAILLNEDLKNYNELITQFIQKMNLTTPEKNPWQRLSIAYGQAFKNSNDYDITQIFKRADKEMNRIKKQMKGIS